MKRHIIKIAGAGVLAAGMIFAQAPAQSATNQSTSSQAGQTASKARAGKRFNRRTGMLRRGMQVLNLTDAQKQQAHAIFQQARESSKPVRDQLRQNRAAMTAAVKADNQSEIQRLSVERGKLTGQMSNVRADAFAKFYQQLTPQQRVKADQMQQRFQARMHRRAAMRTNG